MPSKCFKKVSFCLLFLVLAIFTSAQSFEYVAEKFTKDHGLPDEYIMDLEIDSDGNLWILTRKGLLKFDGYTFEPIPVESILPFKELEIDVNDNLWLKLSIHEKNDLITDRIIIYNTTSKKSLKLSNYCPVGEFDNSKGAVLWQDEARNILLSYNYQSVFRYDGYELKKVHDGNYDLVVNSKNRDPSILSFRRRNQEAIISKNLNTGEVMRYDEKNANFYVWRDEKVMFKSRFDLHRTESIKKRLISGINLISATNDTLEKSGSNSSIYYEFMENEFYYIIEEQLHVFNLDNKSKINLNERLAPVFSKLDLLNLNAHNNIIWVGTNKGLIKIEKRKAIFQKILGESNLSIREMLAIYGDSLLVCTEYGFHILDISTNKVHKVLDPQTQFYGLTEFENGKYLLGTLGSENKIFDPISNTTSWLQINARREDTENGWVGSMINSYLDQNGKIWLTSYGGIWTHNTADESVEWMFKDEIGNISFTDIVKGPDENLIFLLSDDGIFQVDVDLLTIERFTAFDNKIVSVIARDKEDESTYWIGTRYEGLLKWKYGEANVTTINEEDGLGHNNVHSIFEDNYSRLWLSTDYGISVYNKSTHEISVITEDNGIHENEMNRHSYCFVNDSLIYYGGINGIIKFNPYDVRLEDNSSEINLKSFSFVNKLINKQEVVPIKKDINALVIRRYQSNARLIFDIPKNPFSNSLKYIFSSDNNEWSYTQGNFIDLSKLEVGTTNLFVSKKVGINEWSSPKTFSLYKTPPFYRAYWFYGILISLFSLGAFVYINYRRVNILKMNRRIRREVDIKTKELYYKNKSLTESKTLNEQLFSIIGHDLRSPLISLNNISKSINYFSDKGDYDEVKKLTETVESNSKKTLSIIDRLIDWTERQKNMMLEFHEVNISECVSKSIFEHEEFAEKKGIEVISNGREWIKCISNEASLLVVLGNVISNAIKFSHLNGKIEINFNRKDAEIVIEIIDEGIGMDEEQLNKLNNSLSIEPMQGPTGETGLGMGILLSSEIIKKINGKLTYTSKLNQGTTAYIRLPL